MRYLRRHGPRVCHGDVLEVKDDDTAQDLRPGLEDAQLEHANCGLEELLDGIFTRLPITYPVDQQTSAALGPVRRHRDYVVVAYVPHLRRVQLLMNLRMFLFEVVVIHYLSKDLLREAQPRVLNVAKIFHSIPALKLRE